MTAKRLRMLPPSSILAAVAWAPPGCDGILTTPLAQGTYTAEVPCALHIVAPGSAEAHDEFASPITLTVGADARVSVNGVELAVGQQVTRSTPTADLSFEVTRIARQCGTVTVTYAPRPTLPGISVAGELVETYQGQAGSIRATAAADLLLTDVSGTTTFSVECAATLTAESSEGLTDGRRVGS